MSRYAAPIPLMLVTGFLGSGKTTLVNALLRHGDMSGTAVLMNEIGAIGIDHSLVIGASDDILLLDGGCLCCQPQGSVADGISRLLALEPAPKRIVIETSGAANPFPILETLSQHPAAATGFQFPSVMTVVDCVYGQATLARHQEARFQLSAADIVVIRKTDIASASDKAGIEDMVANTNPSAMCFAATGEMLPDGLVEKLRQPISVPKAQFERAAPDTAHAHGDGEFQTVGLQFHGLLEAERVQDWIEHVLEIYGSNLLRIKGTLHLKGYSRPAVLQCVRDTVHPLELLDAQASKIEENSIVAIGWEIHPELLREALGWLSDQATSP